MKNKNRLLSLLILFFTFYTGFAQEPDSLYFESDTLELSEMDSTLIEKTEIDEDLGDIFSEKIDSSTQAWHIKNTFENDSIDNLAFQSFPKDLPDSVYIQRLIDTEQIIDLSYNKVVRNFIQMYTERKRTQVEMMLGLSEYYFPIFEEILDKYDMPHELKYLPIIESALNPVARSRVGATGIWQFMYGTGKQLNLEITSFVDERRDPVKASDAAARYLKELFNIYGDWHLAIAAYNCGPGNVNRAIRRSGGKTNYWEIYYRLPRETRGYVPAFIAATYVMNYYKEHNLLPQIPEMPTEVDTVLINDYLHFDQISATLNMKKEALLALNPMYRIGVIPAKEEKPYPLVLPNEKIMEFIDKDTAVFAYNRNIYFPNNTIIKPSENTSGYFIPVDVKGKAKIIYTVKSGDNVGYISSWYKVRLNDLKYWNNINRNMIRVGQKLAIYVPEKDKAKYEKVNAMSFAEKQAMIGKKVTAAKKTEPQPIDGEYVYYTVKNGDNIWEIAQKYDGISSDEIMQLNKISNEKGLYVGQKLKIKRKT
jgi:membrane-bound lytic murein transglycosylase D